MKAPFSNYLNELAPIIKALVGELEKDYDYVSALSTDSKGIVVRISQRNKNVSNESLTTERGTVIRVRKEGLYSEYAFNDFSEILGQTSLKEMEEAEVVAKLAAHIKSNLDQQLDTLKSLSVEVYDTPVLSDEPMELFVEKETELLPEEMDLKSLVDMFTEISDHGMELSETALDCIVSGQSTHINKMFVSPNRFMCQSYVYSEGTAIMLCAKNGENKIAYEGVSGCCGPEVFQGLHQAVEKAAKDVNGMLDADRIVPGEYDVIVTPDVAGLIAHEAFGHGVEMDMFVKGRALGAEHIGKRVGSDLVTMHEGAKCDESVTAFAFDDEGVLAGDVIEIENGILKTGICDALAAARLGTQPTGNGKRENFAHKAYTRMTNTVFDSGEDTLEDMIKSIEYGYLLDGMSSGMEDPKHWGIQCIVSRGYEIKDGQLTGKMVTPIVLTGYVPDLLGNISMLSSDREVRGNGACGKGHKEWVKVADGGPYFKTRARLG